MFSFAFVHSFTVTVELNKITSIVWQIQILISLLECNDLTLWHQGSPTKKCFFLVECYDTHLGRWRAVIQDFQTIALKPRHRGLGEECTTFFRKGARSSLAANSEYSKRTTIDVLEKRRRIWKRRSKNEGTPAKRTTIDALNERSRKTKKTRS